MAMSLMELRNVIGNKVDYFEALCPDSSRYLGAEQLKKVDDKTENMKLAIIRSHYQARNKFGMLDRATYDMFYIDKENCTYAIEHEDINSEEISKIMNEEASFIIITEGNYRLYLINYSDDESVETREEDIKKTITSFIDGIKEIISSDPNNTEDKKYPNFDEIENTCTILKYNDGTNSYAVNDENEVFIPHYENNCAEMEYGVTFVKFNHDEENSGSILLAGVDGILSM